MKAAPEPDLARQSLGRPITEGEQILADALEAIFASGIHDFDAVAAALQAGDVPPPSGSGEPWTAATLEKELKLINASLDAAYASGGVTPLS